MTAAVQRNAFSTSLSEAVQHLKQHIYKRALLRHLRTALFERRSAPIVYPDMEDDTGRCDEEQVGRVW